MAIQQTPTQSAPGADTSLAQTPGDLHTGIALSPALVMAAALIYTMEADGQAHSSDVSQLQFALEGNQDLYDCAADYVDAVALDQFLQDAPAVLRTVEKICILVNVYDSYVSAGQAGPGRTLIFERLLSAFGMTAQSFMPYSKTIELKNNRAPSGVYTPTQDADETLGAHLALASGMVYMVAADGSIGVQERARLAVITGAFEGLQQAALKYVRRVRVDDFLQQAATVFDQSIKLHILTNVCDTMLSSGDVAPADSRLFLKMLATWGLSGDTFKPYYLLLKIKNVKPFDVGGFRYSSSAAQFAQTASLRTPANRFTSSRSEDAQTTPGSAASTVWVNRTEPQSMGKVRQGSFVGAGGTTPTRRRPRFNLTGNDQEDSAAAQDTPGRAAGVWVRSDGPDTPGQFGSASGEPVSTLPTGLSLAQFTARAEVVRKDTQLVSQLLDELESKMGLVPRAAGRSTSDETRKAASTDPLDASRRFEDSIQTFTVSASDTENTLQTAISDASPPVPDLAAQTLMPEPEQGPPAQRLPPAPLSVPSAPRVNAAARTGPVGRNSLVAESFLFASVASVALVAALTVSAWRPLSAGLPQQLAQQIHSLIPCSPRTLVAQRGWTASAKFGCQITPQPTLGRQGSPTWHSQERVSTMAPSSLPVW